ncbi:MAG: FAD-dependent monooxygenase [Polyangiaceae bacterium]|nr:FAD-dependent monooxygenase [Polyangiaceae bacterium]
MRIVICGAGIAGLSLALCLKRRGHEPILIERAKSLRDSGYMIDFFGPGYLAAEKLGILEALKQRNYPVRHMRFIDERGRDRFSISYEALQLMAAGRVFNLTRGDLERALYEEIEGQVEIRFGTELQSFIDEEGTPLEVTFSNGEKAVCDLLVGADGIHSSLREKVWGPASQFVRFLGYRTAAYIIEAPKILSAVSDSFFSRSLAKGSRSSRIRFAMGRWAIFVHCANAPVEDHSRAAIAGELRSIYGHLGWIVPDMLRELETVEHVYYDSISQVVMDGFTRGRIALMGDSAWCVSLMAGQGASLAVAGGYALAEELDRDGDVRKALERYDARLRGPVKEKLESGRRFAGWFVPTSTWKCLVRDAVVRFASFKPAEYLLKRQIVSDERF